MWYHTNIFSCKTSVFEVSHALTLIAVDFENINPNVLVKIAQFRDILRYPQKLDLNLFDIDSRPLTKFLITYIYNKREFSLMYMDFKFLNRSCLDKSCGIHKN